MQKIPNPQAEIQNELFEPNSYLNASNDHMQRSLSLPRPPRPTVILYIS